MLPNGHTAVNLLGFDEEALARIEEFDDFRLEPLGKENSLTMAKIESFDGFLGDCIKEVQQKQGACVAKAVASGKTGAMPRGSTRRKTGYVGIPGDVHGAA